MPQSFSRVARRANWRMGLYYLCGGPGLPQGRCDGKRAAKKVSVSMNEVSSNYPRSTRQADSGVSVINVLIGIWLIISPFVIMAFSQLMNMRANNVIIGILVGLVALFRASKSANAQWSWLNVIFGIWLIISPFALGVSSNLTAMWHNVIVGIVVGLLALSRAFTPRTTTALQH
jgi:SPW repeat